MTDTPDHASTSAEAFAGVSARMASPARQRHLVGSPFPDVVARALAPVARLQVAAWDRALGRLRHVQEQTLCALVDHAKQTEFGRAHDFAGVRTYDDFVDRVPVGNYDSVCGYIERMRKGERNLLVPEFVRHFGNSSGSSNQGRSKFLPITERQVRFQQRAGADAVLRYVRWSGDNQIFRGFTLGLFPPTTMRGEGPVLITSNPALMATRIPRVTRPAYLPEKDVATIANYDEKLGVIAERYLDHDVRAVAGTTCWFTLLFERVLAAARAKGRPARSVSDVWPNLRVLFGGGVAAAPYVPILRDLVGRAVTLVDTYNATEGGLYAASDFSGADGMLMLPHRGTFFEFVPLDGRTPGTRANGHGRAGDPGVQARERIPLWRVEKDRLYSIVVTTASGLYAYELGDIVRFASVDPPRIEFAGRLSGCLSLTQELTTHVEIERAVEAAAAACLSTTVDFCAAADVGADGTAKSRYLLFVEFQDGAAPAEAAAFVRSFDEELAKQNRVYREHRAGDVALLSPKLVLLAPGAARRYLEEVTHGNVQAKFPRIVNDTSKNLLWKHAVEGR
ncbi:MAG TPA: GH3 auxin-responsive promoter family protein [Polyangiaceae bacterium]|nr:GH3 auxin-responsive promoter family protein [Polyangiaceae bacterium]